MLSINRGRSGVLRFAVATLAPLMILMGLNVPRATADTPNGRTTYIDFHIDAAIDNVPHYRTVVQQLRTASGHLVHGNDIYETMGRGLDAGLVALNLYNADWVHQTTLYFNASNLYLVGFKSQSGQAYLFSDASTNAREEVGREVRGAPVATLPFSGSYTSLVNTLPGAETEPTTIGIYNIQTNVENLARTPNASAATGYYRGNIARAMLVMIGAFAEAARFPMFRDQFEAAFRRFANPSNVVTPTMQALRTSWGQMSRWVRQLISGPPPAPAIFGSGVYFFVLATWEDVEKYLRAINGQR
ncbi:ribosome-inactivating family protein [Streptomyces finlayi]|uniref:ribosome-inactivating family protein n=1 Tax=Streptomyces finlayi TaxID=67296 RepID=UPI0016783EE5|nr:ribosome-inactivating family protein [Streptomyces finlayi]